MLIQSKTRCAGILTLNGLRGSAEDQTWQSSHLIICSSCFTGYKMLTSSTAVYSNPGTQYITIKQNNLPVRAIDHSNVRLAYKKSGKQQFSVHHQPRKIKRGTTEAAGSTVCASKVKLWIRIHLGKHQLIHNILLGQINLRKTNNVTFSTEYTRVHQEPNKLHIINYTFGALTVANFRLRSK